MIEKLVFVVGLSMLVGCNNTSAGSGASGATAASGQSGSRSVGAPAQAQGDRFDGAAPDGQRLSIGNIGIPAGWQGGEFGEVQTKDKSGYAAAYDLPVWPPAAKHVELRVQSLGGKNFKLGAPVDVKVGKAHLPGKAFEGRGDFDGSPAVFYAVAVKVKNDIKVVVIAVKEAARAKLDGDVGNIVRPLGA
jgi:hypothetical protein